MEAKRDVNKKKITGIVVKDRMDKTIVVEVEKVFQHPKYHKYLKRKKRYKVHDEKNVCKLGDMVSIIEARPISKDKRWLLKEILKKEEPFLVQKEVVGDDTGEI